MAWSAKNADEVIKDIIESLGWNNFCEKLGEVVLPVVKEFYANLLGAVDDKVYIRGQWIDISSTTLGKLLNTPEYDEDEYFRLMEKGIETDELEKSIVPRRETSSVDHRQT